MVYGSMDILGVIETRVLLNQHDWEGLNEEENKLKGKIWKEETTRDINLISK